MSLKITTYDIDSHTAEVKHDLGTTDLLVTVWQNGHTVAPSVVIVDENTVKVFGVAGAKLLLGAEEKGKPSAARKTKPK